MENEKIILEQVLPSEIEKRSFEIIGQELEQSGYVPVSYTHLDVYKRQHEFHYWKVEKTAEQQEEMLMDAEKPASEKRWPAMEGQGYVLAGFPHFYYRSCPEFTERFAAACLEYQRVRRRLA